MSLADTINEAMDLIDDVREKLLDMLAECEQEEGNETVRDAINCAASPLIKAYSALEDILSAIEDREPV